MRIVLTLPSLLICTSTFLFAVVAIADSAAVHAQQKLPIKNVQPYLTSNAIALEQAMRAPCNQSINRVPLADAVKDLSSAYSVSIWIDRRIASDQVVSIDKSTSTLSELLAAMAGQSNAALARVDNVVMFVPETTRDTIEANYWQLITQKPTSVLEKAPKDSFKWPFAATSESILANFASKFQVQQTPELELDHDRWREWEFRGTNGAAIGVCLLSGFDRELQANSGRLTIKQMAVSDVPSQVTWTYDSELKRLNKEHLSAWKSKWADAKIQEKKIAGGMSWQITATVSAHRELIAPLIPDKKWEQPTEGKSVLSGQLRGELQKVLATLSMKYKIEFFPQPLPANWARKEIDIKFEKASVEDLLKMIESQSELQFRRQGNKVEINEK